MGFDTSCDESRWLAVLLCAVVKTFSMTGHARLCRLCHSDIMYMSVETDCFNLTGNEEVS